MEQLRAELSHLLGEKLSRIECVNEKADTALWALYDSQGNPMPLMARSRRLLLGINLSDKAVMDFDFPGVGFPV